MPLDGVRALVFDTIGTVVDWRGGLARDAGPFLARHGKPNADPGAFADAWYGLYPPAMEEVRRGRRPFERLDVLHRENLNAVVAEFGLDPARIPAGELDALSLAWHRLDPWPDSVPGLTRLKAGYIIAPLSNGNIILLLDMAKRGGLPWDAILGAEITRVYKPAPEAYLRTAEILAMRPEEVCLVASHASDLAAARACGLKTVFVRRPLEYGPNFALPPQPNQKWELSVDGLVELAAALGL
jgi:2-haloacid dehalogenase